MLSITQIPVGGYDKNFSYLITEADSQQALVVDPSGDLDLIYAALEASDCDVIGVLLTHTHSDHIDQLAELLRSYAIPTYVEQHGADKIISSGTITPINDDDTLTLGSETIKVIHTPGHSADSVCFYVAAAGSVTGQPQLITGDTLFVGGCGRTDPTGVKDLYESLYELKTLPGETVIYPGHDYGSTPTSTMTKEIQNNRFYQAKNFTEFQKLRLG